MKKKVNKTTGRDASGLTRRHFISSLFSLSLVGLARPLLEVDEVDVEAYRSEYLFVNGWIIRNDDYEKIKDV